MDYLGGDFLLDIAQASIAAAWTFLTTYKFRFDDIEFSLFDVLVVGLVIALTCSLIGVFLDWRNS